MKVVYEVFSYHTLAVSQKILLTFTPHGGYRIAPLFHFAYLPLIGETHQIYKEFKEQFVLLTQVYGFQCFQKIAF